MTSEYEFQIITLILSEQQCHRFSRIARDKDIHGGTAIIGKGTVNSATLNLFGIKSQRREIVSIMVEKERAKELLDYFAEELQLNEPGHGIAYVTYATLAEQIINGKQDTLNIAQNMEGDSMYKKMTVIVNRGMADIVMEIARKAGVKGGTVIHGRGTGSEFTEKLFGVEIVPEKELVIILMPSDLVSKVADELYRELQLDVPGNGILFVEPVAEVRGLADSHNKTNNEKE
jgi:nitrogen regulatory protein PII